MSKKKTKSKIQKYLEELQKIYTPSPKAIAAAEKAIEETRKSRGENSEH